MAQKDHNVEFIGGETSSYTGYCYTKIHTSPPSQYRIGTYFAPSVYARHTVSPITCYITACVYL